MWDNDGVDALFDQEGNFRDQEAFEEFVEGYRPEWSFHPDEVDDFENTFNVDFEPIWGPLGNSYPADDRYIFDHDFEVAASSIWHFGRLLGPKPIYGTFDFDVRASPFDFPERAGINQETKHPEMCICAQCLLANHGTLCPGCETLTALEDLSLCQCGLLVCASCQDVHCLRSAPIRNPAGSGHIRQDGVIEMGPRTESEAPQRSDQSRPAPDRVSVNSGARTPNPLASDPLEAEKRHGDIVLPLIRLPTMPPSSTSLWRAPVDHSLPPMTGATVEKAPESVHVPEVIPQLPTAEASVLEAPPRRGWFAHALQRLRRH